MVCSAMSLDAQTVTVGMTASPRAGLSSASVSSVDALWMLTIHAAMRMRMIGQMRGKSLSGGCRQGKFTFEVRYVTGNLQYLYTVSQ